MKCVNSLKTIQGGIGENNEHLSLERDFTIILGGNLVLSSLILFDGLWTMKDFENVIEITGRP